MVQMKQNRSRRQRGCHPSAGRTATRARQIVVWPRKGFVHGGAWPRYKDVPMRHPPVVKPRFVKKDGMRGLALGGVRQDCDEFVHRCGKGLVLLGQGG